MERWDYIRFVYMTESLAVIGLGSNPFTSSYDIPEVPGIDGVGFDVPKTTAKPGGGGWVQKTPDTECFDANGNKKASKECDQEVQGGSSLVDPCWMLNEYPGMTSYTEGGHQKVIAGEIPLLRGGYKSIRTRMGWGFHGSGSWPDNYQGAFVSLVYTTADGREAEDCGTYGWTLERCRNPVSSFPLDAPACYGEQIGGDRSNQGDNLMATMWDRFETCMRQRFPECGEG